MTIDSYGRTKFHFKNERTILKITYISGFMTGLLFLKFMHGIMLCCAFDVEHKSYIKKENAIWMTNVIIVKKMASLYSSTRGCLSGIVRPALGRAK